MFLEETPEQQALRAELRAYYAELLTPEVRAGLADGGEGGDMWRQVIRRIGADGWLGIGWPKEVGGQGRPATDQFIFFDETRRASAPFPFVTINTVGPDDDDLRHRGAEEVLPAGDPVRRDQLRDRLHRARSRNRPGVAAHEGGPRRRRVRDQREQDLHFRRGPGRLHMARGQDGPGSPEAQGHLDHLRPDLEPRVLVQHHHTVGGLTTSASYYSDVHVPVANRVGEENEGWRMITTQLNHERVGIAAWAGITPSEMWNGVARWAADTTTASPDGIRTQTMLDLPWVRTELARTHAELRAMYLLNWRMAVDVSRGIAHHPRRRPR